ncbi:MAG: hypothetical protein P4L75_06800 [Clostridia bacterium]|nr:hypothetical protein [Clostridia bacterium]MDR3644306.1 hypothetical protein [Clostridia bacterium]
MNASQPLTAAQWAIVAAAVALCIPQGILLFRDAQKRGRFPWFWGLWGLVSFPLPSILYYFFIVRRDQKHKGGRHSGSK